MMKRILSLLLALLMVVSAIPVQTFAEGEETENLDACTVCGELDCGFQHTSCEVCGDYDCGLDHNAAAVVNDACPVCGELDCGLQHTYCEACEIYDCGVDHGAAVVVNDPCPACGELDCGLQHTYCEACETYDCGVDHSVAVAAFEGARDLVAEPEEPALEIPACPGAPDCWGTAHGLTMNNHQDSTCTRKEYLKTFVTSTDADGVAAVWNTLTDAEKADVMAMVEAYTSYADALKEKVGWGTTAPENPCGCCDDCTGVEDCECVCDSCTFKKNHGAVIDEGEPEPNPMVGRLVKLVAADSFRVRQNPADWGTFVGASAFPEVMKIKSVSQSGSEVLYQLVAADGYTWPTAPDGNNYEGYYLDSTRLELIEEKPEEPENPCGCCDDCTGKEGCECVCGECDFCEKEPEQEETTATSQGSVSGATATGTMSADAVLTVDNGDAAISTEVSDKMIDLMGDATCVLYKGYVFDIGLTGDYAGGITLTIPSSQIPVMREDEEIRVIHLLDSVDAVKAAKDRGTAKAYSATGLADSFPDEVAASGESDTLFYEELDAERDSDGNVVFTTTSFSTFITYTVDFHFNGIDFSIPGESEILLSELFVALEINKSAADATSVVFSDPSLVAVEQLEGDWKLISLLPFDSNETLEIAFSDGSTMTIDVTDDENTQRTSDGKSVILFADYQDGTIASITYVNILIGGFQSYWYLHNGDVSANPQVSYSHISSQTAVVGNQFGITSDYYWYEMSANVTNVDYQTGKSDTFVFGAIGKRPEIHYYRHSNQIYNDSNYCSVRQVSQAVFSGDVVSRSVAIYADNNYVTTVTKNFPSRNKNRGFSASDVYVDALYGPYYKSSTSVVNNSSYRVDIYSRYTLNASVNDDKGSVDKASQWVDCNQSGSVTFTANTGYHIDYVMDGTTKEDVTNASSVTYTASNITADRALVAHAVPITYTVAYNGNGATSGSTESSSHTYDVAKNLTTNGFSRTGYKFNGWNTAANGTGTSYTDKQSVSNLTATDGETVTLYAQWESRYQYQLTFNKNTTDIVSNMPTNLATTDWTDATTYTYNWSEEPTRIGYTFAGWATSASATSGSTAKSHTITGTAASNAHVNLYAIWNANGYAVTYNANGGSGAPAEQTKTHDVNLTLSTTKPTRSGYAFLGWNTKTDGTGTSYASGATYTANAAVTLYAQWKPIYKVTLNNQGATAAGTTAYWYIHDTVLNGVYYYTDAACTTPLAGYTITKPTKTGYTFGGYYTGTDGVGTQYVDQNGMCINNIYQTAQNWELKAQWVPITYQVKYDANGGSGSMSNSSHTYGTAKELTANTFTAPAGKKFAGWNTAANGSGTSYADKASVMNLATTNGATVTLYAQWDPQYKYQLTFNANTTDTVRNMPDNLAVTGWQDEASYTYQWSKEPTREGYTFAGWSTSSTATTGSKDKNHTIIGKEADTAGVTLYAIWTTKTDATYTVHYYVEGSTEKVQDDKVATGRTFNQVYTETAPGIIGSYILVGSNTQSVTAGYTNNEITFYYKLNAFSVSYAYTGSVPTGAPAVPAAAAKTVGSSVSVADSPTLPGYTFSGWSTSDAAISNGTFTMPNHAVTLTGSWTPITYTISYNLDGGSISPANPTSYTVKSAPITLNKPTKTGYTFAGWTGTELTAATKDVTIPTGSIGNRSYTATWSPNTDATYTVHYYVQGSTEKVQDDKVATGQTFNQVYTETAPEIIGNYIIVGEKTRTVTAGYSNNVITFYYKLNAFSVTYQYDGTAPEGAPTVPAESTETVGSSVSVAAAPTLAGYTFSGWSANGIAITDGKFTMPNHAVTLTGSWTPVTYTISYDLDGGSVSPANPTSYTVESAPITLHKPTKTGYTFAGWTGTGLNAATQDVTIPTGSIGDRSYTATWTPITYTITYDYADGITAEKKVNYDIEDDLTLESAPSREGYKFTGWKLETLTYTNWTAGDYEASQNVGTGKYGNVTFKAQWEEQYRYVLKFDANDGSNAPATMTQEWCDDARKAFTWTTVPTRNGYTFLGWAEAADSTENVAGEDKNTYTLTGTPAQTVEKTLYAIWERQTGSLLLDYNGDGTPVIVTITGTDMINASEEITITVVITGDTTITDLPTGAYTVTAESARATYTASAAPGSANVESGKTAEVDVTVSTKGTNWFTGFSRVINTFKR